MEKELTLVLECYNLPGREFDGRTDNRLGIQKGDDVIEDVSADSAEVAFAVPLRILFKAEGAIDFRGSYVQGKLGDRFVYLSWGVRESAGWITVRRAKFYLRYLDAERINTALDNNTSISVRLNMTDAKGKPLTASVREESFQFV